MKTATYAASAASLISAVMAQQFVLYTPGNDDTSVERADPILSPGTISQHTHQFFGSNAFAPNMSYESLLNSGCTTVADSSNRAITYDSSVYWHPAMFVKSNDGSGDWLKVPMNGHKLYYKDAGSTQDTKRDPFEFPDNFRMLTGNAMMRAPYTDVQQQNITQWICHDSSGTNQGTFGGFPTGVIDCDAVDGLNGAVHFPHCWNGQDFDQANPTAHITYPDGDIENGVCPSSHPTRLPHIFIENTFNIHNLSGKYEPNSFTLAMGDSTGYGWHMDFFNGWQHNAIPSLLSQCPQGAYGNEDVGTCPNFESRTTAADACTLPSYYPENVDSPGAALPGCNPVQTVNPALDYATAPLGTYSTNCQLASNSSSSVSSAVSSVASGVSTMASSAVSSVVSGASSILSSIVDPMTASSATATSSPAAMTTFATSVSGSYGGGKAASVTTAFSSAGSNSVDVVTVTDEVTVTDTVTETVMPTQWKARRHAHAGFHFGDSF